MSAFNFALLAVFVKIGDGITLDFNGDYVFPVQIKEWFALRSVFF